mmetsp:Transcript_7621/g.12659  ORF Transcript_7621/g.12659 Transcript_7621/m.12659 type:complete len:363 (+) Transcript_7621:601-1689(+)
MLSQDGFDALLVLRIDITEDDALCWAHDHAQVVLVNEHTKSSLQAEVTLVLHTAVLDVLSVKELSVALVPPAHPVVVLPVLDWSPWRNWLAKVTLHQLAEVVNSKSVNQVLHTSIGTHVTVTVITLGSQNGLHNLHNVFLGDVSHVVGSTSKRVLLVVGTTQTSTNHQVESLEFTGFVANDNDTNVVGVHVKRVVSRNSDTNLELARQVAVSVDRLNRVRKNDTTSRIVQHSFIDIVVRNFAGPTFNRGSFFAIKPDLRKCWSHGAEELSKDLGVFASVVVLGSIEWSWGGHDVTRDITASTDRGGANVHDGRNDRLEVTLQDTVHLKALTGGCSEISLTLLAAEVVEQTVEVWWELTSWLL